MKRFLFTLGIILSLSKLAFSQQVLRQEAVKAAVNTLKSHGRTTFSEMDVSAVNTIANRSDTLIYEVLFHSGESVLLSGNKSCLPILGYNLPETVTSPQSIIMNYDNLPDGLRAFLEEYLEQIEYCFSHNMTSDYCSEWYELQQSQSNRSPISIVIPPLVQSKWGQSYSNDSVDASAYNYAINSYSYNCPKCFAGCIAVAMGQIMNYWKYPVWMPDKSEQFDWCNMSDSLVSSHPKYYIQRDAVANLLKECGDAADIVYCISGCSSGTFGGFIPDAFISFEYADDVTYKNKSLYTSSHWREMLQDNLDNYYPILYSGTDDTHGSHAFVCDGYDNMKMFHFNWGYNGKYNMWCTLDQLNPHIYSFNSKQAAVFNIHPSGLQDYCNFELPLIVHYLLYYNINGNTTPDPYANVPKTFTRLTSVPNNYQSSWRTIPTGAISEYVAHEEVILQDGFLAETGSDFYAYISPCESCDDRMVAGETSDVAGGGNDNPTDTLPAPKSLQTETTQSDDAALTVYPNPTDDLLYIELSGANIATVALYDLQGRLVETLRATSLQVGTVSLNVKSVPAGVYVLCVTDTNGKEYRQKIVRR